jgi:hypothetical protein
MGRDRQEFLQRLEDRLSRVSRWLAAKRRIGEQAPERLHPRIEAIRRDVAQVRHATDQAFHDAVAKARASLDDMDRDYDSPPLRPALRREELQALRRSLQLTARLLPHLSNLDDPAWGPAHEEYERSWDEMHRAFQESEGAARP